LLFFGGLGINLLLQENLFHFSQLNRIEAGLNFNHQSQKLIAVTIVFRNYMRTCCKCPLQHYGQLQLA
jgi:hypothetical protein